MVILSAGTKSTIVQRAEAYSTPREGSWVLLREYSFHNTEQPSPSGFTEAIDGTERTLSLPRRRVRIPGSRCVGARTKLRKECGTDRITCRPVDPAAITIFHLHPVLGLESGDVQTLLRL